MQSYFITFKTEIDKTAHLDDEINSVWKSIEKQNKKKRIIKVAIAAILVAVLIPLIIIGANYMYGADNTDTAKSPYFSDEILNEFDKGYSQSDQKQLEPLLNDIKMLLISMVNMKPPKENSENLRIIHMTVLRAITQSKLRLN